MLPKTLIHCIGKNLIKRTIHQFKNNRIPQSIKYVMKPRMLTFGISSLICSTSFYTFCESEKKIDIETEKETEKETECELHNQTHEDLDYLKKQYREYI